MRPRQICRGISRPSKYSIINDLSLDLRAVGPKLQESPKASKAYIRLNQSNQ